MSTLERTQYGFDRDSRRTWQKRPLAAVEDLAYRYDGLNQVTTSARGALNINTTAIAGRPVNEEAFDYDPTGNWRGYQVSAEGITTLDQSRVHDRGNRLTQIVDNPNAMILDRAGRMRQMSPNAAGNWSGKHELTWDAWSRITAVKSDGMLVGTYQYDAMTRRITRTLGSTVWHTYYSDQWRPMEERKNADAFATIHYLWGARHRDDLARRDRVTSGTAFNETRYVMMDYFNPMALCDATGAVTERYAFSAFGKRRVLAPDWSARSGSECAMEFAFQGQFFDAESGLYNYGFRYYSPELGRWTCKDLLFELGGFNLYLALKNDGTNLVDHYGLEPRGQMGPPPPCAANDPNLNSIGTTAVANALTQPNANNRRGIEYCGLICVVCEGGKPTYYMTGPHEGTTGDCDNYAEGTCQEVYGDDAKLAGTYHTHPDSLPPSRMGAKGEDGSDVPYCNRTNVPMFVGGPEGPFWRHDPGSDPKTGMPNQSVPLPRKDFPK